MSTVNFNLSEKNYTDRAQPIKQEPLKDSSHKKDLSPLSNRVAALSKPSSNPSWVKPAAAFATFGLAATIVGAKNGNFPSPVPPKRNRQKLLHGSHHKSESWYNRWKPQLHRL